MIEIELRTPQRDERTDEVRWTPIARLRVAGPTSDVHDPGEVLDFSLPVPSLRTGEIIRFDDDPEEWARNLATVYHAPDLVVAVIDDDNPIPAEALHRDVVRQRVRLRQRVGV
jgi:hypothetical protein